MRRQLEGAAQCVLALSAGEADARTYGAATIQLFLDLLGDGDRTDRTLNGPTSDAWLEPWREHLQRLGVRFFLGELDRLDLSKGELVPVFKDVEAMRQHSQDAHQLLTHEEHEEGRKPDFYVLALDLDAAAALTAPVASKKAPDFAQLQVFYDTVKDRRGQDGQLEIVGLKDMTGIQFFFDAKASIGAGHTYYPFTKWGLSSISQSEFWSERGGFADGYLGVFSVDISATGADADVRTGGCPGKTEPQREQLQARDEIQSLGFRGAQALRAGEAGEWEPADLAYGNLVAARAVWDQLVDRIGDRDKLPEPRAFHVDQNVEMKERKLKNTTPFLAALPKTWKLRPGIDPTPNDVDADKRVAGKHYIRYAINHKRWVLCGTFMATHTRMTSMEAANESGRHAAIAILKRLQASDSAQEHAAVWEGNPFKVKTLENKVYNHASDQRIFDHPDIIEMEDNELDDLKFMREIDSALYKANLPHWMDICDFDQRLELAVKAAQLDRNAGIELSEGAQHLVASTIKNIETLLGADPNRKLLNDDHRKAVDAIRELIKKFLR
jgi:hypothetical protein